MKYSRMASHRSDSHLWTGAVTVAGLVTGALLACVADSWAATPLGLWYAEGGAVQVEIRECDTALCGRVVWLRSPLDTQGCALLGTIPMLCFGTGSSLASRFSTDSHRPIQRGKSGPEARYTTLPVARPIAVVLRSTVSIACTCAVISASR